MKGEADLYLICGGSSAGSSDLTLKALSGAGRFHLVFHGVSIRPGRPLAAGLLEGKPVIVLPGYPAAAMLTFHVFVKPFLGEILGVKLPSLKVRGRLTRRVASQPGIRDLVRVKLHRQGEEWLIEPLRVTGAGIISSVTKADGLLIIPEEVEGYEKDETVEVEMLRA